MFRILTAFQFLFNLYPIIAILIALSVGQMELAINAKFLQQTQSSITVVVLQVVLKDTMSLDCNAMNVHKDVKHVKLMINVHLVLVPHIY